MPVPTGDNDNDYDALATNYAEHADNNAYNAHYERPASLALVGNPARLRVLDAGCGPGTHAAALIDGGATVTGLDSSAAMPAVARERLGPDVPLHRADLADPLPLPDAACCRPRGSSSRRPSRRSRPGRTSSSSPHARTDRTVALSGQRR
jgi:SAM-dependent methyltransferase